MDENTKIIGGVLILFLSLAILVEIVRYMWSAVMPMFALPELTYLQTLYLMLLLVILNVLMWRSKK